MKPIDRRFPESAVRRSIVHGLLAAALLLASSTAWALPDLVVSGIDTSGVTSDCRDASVSGSMVVTVRNAGPDAVTVATRLLGFRDIDLDGAFSPTVDLTLGDVATPPLGLGESVDATVPLSGTLDFAGAPVSFFADRTNLVREVSEGNNVTSSGAFSEAPPTSTTFTFEEEHADGHDQDQEIWGASSALVAQVTDDDESGLVDERDDVDILWLRWVNGGQENGARLRLVDGRTRALHAVSPASPLLASIGAPAIGDLDGDGLPEIVAVTSDLHLVAFDNDLNVKWIDTTHELPGRADSGGAVSIVDLDGRGRPEIVLGAVVFTFDGRFVADGAAAPVNGYAGFGCSESGLAIQPRSAVADVDLDGTPEIIAGASMYRYRNGRLVLGWKREDIGEGWTAAANLDDDPEAEIVLVQQRTHNGQPGRFRVLDHDGTDPAFWNPPNGGWVTCAV